MPLRRTFLGGTAVQIATAEITDAEIKALATGALNITTPLVSDSLYRHFIGGIIWLDTRYGAYTNLAIPSPAVGETPATGVTDLYLSANGSQIFAPFEFLNVWGALTNQALTRFLMVPRARLLDPNGGQLKLNNNNITEVGSRNINGYDQTVLGEQLNGQVNIAIDNYTGDFDVDLGALTDGHPSNKMIVEIHYLELAIPVFDAIPV